MALVLGHIAVTDLEAEEEAPRAIFHSPEVDEPGEPFSSPEGHVLLVWGPVEGPGTAADLHYRLEQARNEDFSDATVIYEGPDEGRFVTGLPAGHSYFRVRARDPETGDGPWSDPVMAVEVIYPSMKMVYAMMAAGLVMAIILVVVITRGAKRTRTT